MCIYSVYLYTRAHTHTQKEYIKKTMKSSQKAIYRLNIFFTLCLKENQYFTVVIIYTALYEI